MHGPLTQGRLRQDRVGKPSTVDAHEERRLGVLGAEAQVVGEERLQRRVDGYLPLSAVAEGVV